MLTMKLEQCSVAAEENMEWMNKWMNECSMLITSINRHNLHLSIHLSIHPYIHPSIYLSIHPSYTVPHINLPCSSSMADFTWTGSLSRSVDNTLTRTLWVRASDRKVCAYWAKMAISVCTSIGSLLQFSVEKAYTVTTSTPSCLHHWMKSTRVCPPDQCP